jgi:hypothetical protein
MSFFDESSLCLIPSGYKNQKLYSVKPLDGSGDLTFSRASSATRVASNGLIEKVRTNLVTYSNDFSNAAWGKVTDGTYSIATESIVDAFGNTSAVYKVTPLTGTFLVLRNTLGSATTQTTNFSIYVKKTNASSYVGIDIDNNTDTAAAANTNWQRISNTRATASFVDITFYSLNEPIYIFASQVELGDIATDYIATTSAAVSVGPVSGLPRLDYLNSTCPRLLLEPQRSSLVLYSEQMDNAAWNKNNLTITANNLVSPDGYTNADTALETATNAFHDLIQSPSLTSGTTYTLSSFVKAAGRDYCYLFLSDGTTPAAVKFNLATGVILGTATGSPVSSKIENYGNGWYRCSMVYTSGATATGTLAISATNSPALSLSAYAGDITKGIAVYGAQLEAGAYATSYIPTLGTSVTRVWDDASKTGITSLIGQTAGTLFVELNADGRSNATARVIAYLTANGSTDNRVAIQYNASGQIQAIASSGGSTQGSVVYTITGPCKAAFAYNSSGYELFVNGVSRGTFTGSLPTSLTRLDMNSLAGTFDELGGTINQVLIFKTRLSNSDLATLTTL